MKKCSLDKALIWSLTLATFSLPVSASIFQKADLKGQVRLGGDYVDNKQVEARVFGVSGFLGVKADITDTLQLKIKAGATLEVGSNNSFIIDEYAPRRQWRLRDAHFKWSPFDFLSVKAGAVNQGDYNSPLLLTSSAFLALQEKLSINFSENHSFYVRAEQAIPNNFNLTQRIGIVEDGTPSFLIESVGLDLKGDILSLFLEGGMWSFNSLSTGAAYQSQFLGNSVSGGGQLNSDFLYSFSGYNFAGGMEAYISDDIGVEFKGQYLYNDKAPEERNKGQLFKAGVILGKFRPSFTFFRNESDSSVGFYNSALFSHNNHEGTILAVQYKEPHIDPSKSDDHISALIGYADSSPIKFNNFQSDTKKVAFQINFPYDL